MLGRCRDVGEVRGDVRRGVGKCIGVGGGKERCGGRGVGKCVEVWGR